MVIAGTTDNGYSRFKEMTEINIKIDSDDLFEVFGWLSLLSKGLELPKELNDELIFEVTTRIVKSNIENKEFLQAIYGQSR